MKSWNKSSHSLLDILFPGGVSFAFFLLTGGHNWPSDLSHLHYLGDFVNRFHMLAALRKKLANDTTVTLYFEHPLSRASLYLELKSQSLYVGCNLFFSLYLELSLSRSNFLAPCEFEIVRVNCIYFYRVNTSRTWSFVNWLILINLISKFFVRNSPLLKSLSECLSFKYNFVSPLLKLITAISWRYG